MTQKCIAPKCIDRMQNKALRGALALLCGVLWATLWGNYLLSDALPLALDKSDYYVSGVVSGLPDSREGSTRFIFEVESLSPVAASKVLQGLPEASTSEPAIVPNLKRLQLNWYGPVDLLAGQRWRFEVRLRSPRGFANPGGFDYRLWLLRQGISATGYVRNPAQAQLIDITQRYPIDRFRRSIRNMIINIESDEGDTSLSNTAKQLLVALTIGDKRGLSGQIWQKFRATGTIHLLIISGLHIGMAAAVGMFVGSLLGRCLVLVGFNCTSVQIGAVFALTFATVYALMAGFSLPTQRALIMLSVFLAAVLWKRSLRPWPAFIWAITIQAVVDPLAALSAGFCLSYGAVAVFIWYFSSHPRVSWAAGMNSHWRPGGSVRSRSTASRFNPMASKLLMYGQTLLEAQLLVLLLLSGVVIYFQGNTSLLAPFVNVLALPWFSLLIVPPALLGVLVLPLSETLANSLWWLATCQLQYFDQILDKILLYAQYGVWKVVTDQYLLLSVAVVVTGWFILLPRGLGTRAMAFVLMIALLMIAPPQRLPLEVVVLDVGQGLSVVVLTPEGVLVYDTGGKYSEHFDIGSGVVAPYLRSRGVERIDVLMVSHSDADHSGGVSGLLGEFEVQRLVAGQPDQLQGELSASRVIEQCRAGMSWRWGKVEFELIHPASGGRAEISGGQISDNASSCVMTVRMGEQSILLSGDIEADVERKLLENNKLPSELAVLIAPHHGSKTSSTPDFVKKVAPEHVVYSAGFHHHFGHPHPSVIQRYQGLKAQQWSTAQSGALSFSWSDSHNLQPGQTRESLRGYWQESF
jgi:competence protein ComEC